ncbi:hypothetical protein ACHABQ_05265 [Nesterenkonia aurantiaca]|uniref:hypothetical protein n=1 Tax=Nesterenkonia aurantiaca TaxID=1436010 RepID=UPI003EE706C5
MTPEASSRREELIAGALTDDLSDAEWEELNDARTADPSIDVEIAELSAIAERLDGRGLTWREESPSRGLEERIRAATSQTEPYKDNK